MLFASVLAHMVVWTQLISSHHLRAQYVLRLELIYGRAQSSECMNNRHTYHFEKHISPRCAEEDALEGEFLVLENCACDEAKARRLCLGLGLHGKERRRDAVARSVAPASVRIILRR